MRLFWIFLVFPVCVFAGLCKVDGISDSPQKINCFIHFGSQIQILDINCDERNYKVVLNGNSFEVDYAYHEEVDAGSNPIVFVFGDNSLTTTSYQMYALADLTLDGHQYDGLCFYK